MLRFSSLWQTWHFFALWANTRSSGSRTSAEPSLQDKRHSESLKNRTRANLFSPLQLPALFWTFRSGCPKTGTPDAGTNRLLHSHNATDCWCPLLQRRRKRIWRGQHWVAETGLCQVVRLPSVGLVMGGACHKRWAGDVVAVWRIMLIFRRPVEAIGGIWEHLIRVSTTT